MFRSRTSSAKPRDELLADFRQQFPEIVATSTAPGQTQPVVALDNPALDAPPVPAGIQNQTRGTLGDQEPTPRASSNEPWRFTPSFLDSTFSFGNFSNAQPGYCTPTPGGTNTIYHPQAGDLHAPTLGLMGLNTPLSMPTSETGLNAGAGAVMDVHGFQTLPSSQFHHFNPFIQIPPPAPPAFVAPASFSHHDTGYETMEQDSSPLDSEHTAGRITSMDGAFRSPTSPVGGALPRPFGRHETALLPPTAEKFRFHSTLNAPTAMIRHADEIPVTYLNKGQAYSLTVSDTANLSGPVVPGMRYRTYVRISFEDEQQKKKPGVCWTLWKEGRGTNEAHQRGGKLQAVEYVEAGRPPESDEKHTRVELESSSFDGFSAVWTPGVHGAPEVTLAVRFNFLSTDFSHSKGVKGIPVRLCAKTAPFPSGDPAASPTDVSAAAAAAEICYCKVKLFRDHGAERKLANDVAHVKKSIEKIKQQIAQAESGMKEFGKRKRTAASQSRDAQRPGKIQKHKRTWSISSASSVGGGDVNTHIPVEEDLHAKLQVLQDMFTSPRPASVLFLRGEERDDPDLYPVSLGGSSSRSPEPVRVDPRDGPTWQIRSGRSSLAGSSLVSPSPSSLSLTSQASVHPGGGGGSGGGAWAGFDSGGDTAVARKGPVLGNQPTRVERVDDPGRLSGWIEALGVDPSYRPPPDRLAKPVACFYVLRRGFPFLTPQQQPPDAPAAAASPRECYRAVYLARRTLVNFRDRVAAKWGLDASRIVQCVRVLPSGLAVEMDDDVIRETREGQDMVLVVEEMRPPGAPAVKREWEMTLDAHDDAPHADGAAGYGGLVLRLAY